MNYVIIGGGAAGVTAAAKLHKLDPAGLITLIAPEARIHSRCLLPAYLAGERTAAELDFTPAGFWEQTHMNRRQTTVRHLDTTHRQVLTDAGAVPYDRLLIASGADSFIPPVPGFREGINVAGLRHLADVEFITAALPAARRAVVIGSGLVGLDAAYGLLKRGLDVDIVEMAERILPLQLDANAAREYQRRFEAAGARFHLGVKAGEATLDADRRVTAVRLSDGTALACDLLIVAAGVRPATAFLADSPVAQDRGITVDERLQTNVPDIYAAGDVTGLSGIWPNAQQQGQIAACNMAGQTAIYEDRYAIKNTINFYGLASLCIGVITPAEGDTVLVKEDRLNYKRLILRADRVVGVLLQGDLSYAGFWQHLIKTGRLLPPGLDPFRLNYGYFYHRQPNGEYSYAE